MNNIKDILFIILGMIITLACVWFFFTIALPVLLILGLGVLIYFGIRGTSFFKRTKKKVKKGTEKIQEAVIIDEK